MGKEVFYWVFSFTVLCQVAFFAAFFSKVSETPFVLWRFDFVDVS